MARTRKSSVQVRFEILEFLFQHAGAHARTSLWRRATQLSYGDFQKHLTQLKEKGFVDENESGIHLTPLGAELYRKLCEALPSIL